MDTTRVTRGIKAAYTQEHYKPYRRTKPYQVGIGFDIAVGVFFLLTLVGYLMS